MIAMFNFVICIRARRRTSISSRMSVVGPEDNDDDDDDDDDRAARLAASRCGFRVSHCSPPESMCVCAYIKLYYFALLVKYSGRYTGSKNSSIVMNYIPRLAIVYNKMIILYTPSLSTANERRNRPNDPY